MKHENFLFLDYYSAAVMLINIDLPFVCQYPRTFCSMHSKCTLTAHQLLTCSGFIGMADSNKPTQRNQGKNQQQLLALHSLPL